MINKCVLMKPKEDHSGTFGRLSVFVALQEPVIVKQVCKKWLALNKALIEILVHLYAL